jgi:hypothetical protein
MHKITSTFVGVGLSALVLSGCATTTTAETGLETSTGVQQVQSPRATSFEDMSDEEAAAFDALAKAQEPLGVAVGKVEEQFPDDFAYDFFERETLHVGFKGAAPEGAVALLEATGGSYVVIEEAGFNAVDYQAAADSVSEQTRKYVTEERSVTIGKDSSMEPGAIVVQFHADEKQLTYEAGLADSLDVDDRFRVILDFTETSPLDFDVLE